MKYTITNPATGEDETYTAVEIANFLNDLPDSVKWEFILATKYDIKYFFLLDVDCTIIIVDDDELSPECNIVLNEYLGATEGNKILLESLGFVVDFN